MHQEAETEKQPSNEVENHTADSPTIPGPPLFSDVVKQPSLNTTTTPGTGQQGHKHMNARGNRGVGHGLQRGNGEITAAGVAEAINTVTAAHTQTTPEVLRAEETVLETTYPLHPANIPATSHA